MFKEEIDTLIKRLEKASLIRSGDTHAAGSEWLKRSRDILREEVDRLDEAIEAAEIREGSAGRTTVSAEDYFRDYFRN